MNDLTQDELADILEKAWYESVKDASITSLEQSLEMACKAGNLKSIRHLFANTALKNSVVLQEKLNSGLCNAAERKHLDVVKYLLLSDELSTHADIHANNDYSVFQACMNGDLEMVRFLCSSPELTEHSNIHNDNDIAFRLAAIGGKYNVIQYLIFELNIEKSPMIRKFLEKEKNIYVKKMFEQRELNKDLNENLTSKPNSHESRIKI